MRFFFFAAAFLVSLFFFTSCTKPADPGNDPGTNPDKDPAITHLVPNQGTALINDTIHGMNFSTLPDENVVMYNGVQAIVLSASSTQLVVMVPQNGTTGPVRVTVKNRTAIGPVFTYITAPVDSVMVSTFAGSGILGRTDGANNAATFGYIWDLEFDKGGNLWVADGSDNKVRTIYNGIVSSLQGQNTFPGQSKISLIGIALDPNQLVYVTDEWSAPVRTISSTGVVSNFVGNGFNGTADGTGPDAYFRGARTMVFDKAGNLFVVDVGNSKIRKVTPAGVVTTFAGDPGGIPGWVDGTGTASYFSHPQGIAIDKDDNLYVADHGNNKIRKITPAGVVTTIAGNNIGNHQDGFGLAAGIGGPFGIAVDDLTGNVYVSQPSGAWIRKIRPNGYVSTIAGTGGDGSVDGPGRTASFKSPLALAVDSEGNLFVGDAGNYKIRKITFR